MIVYELINFACGESVGFYSSREIALSHMKLYVEELLKVNYIDGETKEQILAANGEHEMAYIVEREVITQYREED